MKAMILRSSNLKKFKTPLSEKMSYTILTCRSKQVEINRKPLWLLTRQAQWASLFGRDAIALLYKLVDS